MKKPVSIICCVLYMHSFSQPPIDTGSTMPRSSGEKVLIKALAVFMNPEGHKKVPAKTINLSSSEGPL